MEKLVIVGLSTNARHVYEFVKSYGLYEIVGFAVNEQYKTVDTFKGLPVYSLETLDRHFDKTQVKLFIALLWNHLNADRRRLYEALTGEGWQLANLISPSATVRGTIRGTNVWVHDNVVIQNDTVIGNDVAIMAFTLIGADSVVGDHCFFGARSSLGGESRVGEQCFIGMSCVVFDNTTIGNKCILGACTAVKRNVPDYSLYKTSSDMQIKQYSEEEIENKLVYSFNRREGK